MTTRDLMIGDYITFKDALEDKVILPVKIVAIGYQWKGEEDEVLAQIGDDDTCDIIVIDEECVGIPLTEEVLKKNGFVGKEHYGELLTGEWQILCDCFHVAAGCHDGWQMDIPCRLVHELQHAFRLCGIEKEIKL